MLEQLTAAPLPPARPAEHPLREEILSYLDTPRTARELSKILPDIPCALVSQHLRTLDRQGKVEKQGRGKLVTYIRKA